MVKPLRLTVLTLAETLLDVGEVDWVQARLADGGGIGIYPGHAPLLAETVTALLRYADPSGEHTLDLEAGILQVERDGVTVFTSGVAHDAEVSDTARLSGSAELTGEGSSRSLEVSEDARFDRLAQALLVTMRAQPQGVLDVSDEDE